MKYNRKNKKLDNMDLDTLEKTMHKTHAQVLSKLSQQEITNLFELGDILHKSGSKYSNQGSTMNIDEDE